MKKKLGFYSIVLLTINSIIGTGIFLSPGSVVAKSGNKALMVYALAAIFSAVLAVTFAAAAKYVSKGGAAYAYTKAAFGDDLGYYVGITRYVAAGIAWGVMGTAVVKTVLKIFGLNYESLTTVTIGFMVLMGILMIINLLGTRVFEIINNLSTIGKVGALVTTIIVGLVMVLFLGENNYSAINNLTDDAGQVLGSNLDITGWVTAVIAAFYAFTGFESVASASEDMEEPEKNLPRAIPLAIGIIAAIYMGIVGIAMAINPEALVTSKEVVALADVFSNRIIRNLIIGGALVSMFGINVAASFGTPRILESMSNQGQVPKIFSKRTENGFPIASFLTTITIAVVIPLAFKFNMASIMIISSISRFIQFVIVPISIIMFYYGKQKEEVMPNVKKNFATDVIIPIIALGLTLVLLYKFNWVGQFTTVDDSGQTHANMFAIISMIVGYVVLPACLMTWSKIKRK
ncbi:APC family permease [Peptoniphilus duerdenii]|uniref:APC family permease n=1 Tax=Peptoniphilus duerdenii TaxID=507750 RepID=UPI00288ABBF0|nr:APC family permease [Peptoniphilus duerdenii]